MKKLGLNWKIFMGSLVTIAIPIALQNLLGTTAGMVDTVMIGTQGELSVAAVGICSQVNSLFFSAYFGFASGAQLFFSQYWGAHDEDGINRTAGLALMWMLLVAVLFGGFCVLAPRTILGIYTDKQDIIDIGYKYIRIVGFSYPLTAIAVLESFLLRSTERVRPPLYASIVALIVNFCLNWLLINGHFGMPKMGAAGAAVGTLCSAAVNVVILLIYILRSGDVIRLRISRMFSWGNGFFGAYMKRSFPIMLNEMLYGVGQMVINIVMGHQAESAIAAMAAFRVLEGFVFAFFGGLADASYVMIGKEIGAGEHKHAYSQVWGFAIVCPLITFVIVLICFLLHQPLYSLFGLGEQAIYYGKYMLLIYLGMGTVRTCDYIINTCFRAGGEPTFGTILEIVCLFALTVPATWVSGMVLHLPFLAVFAFVYTDELIRFFFEIHRVRTGKWIRPVTEEGKKALPEFLASLKHTS